MEQVQDPFERLIEAMPKISEAVNSFTSAEVQSRAFEALIATLGATPSLPSNRSVQTDPPAGAQPATDVPAGSEEATASGAATKAKPAVRKRAAGSKKVWPVNREINWSQAGKSSLKDLVDEKNPQNNYDKCLVVAYYLVDVLAQATFDVPDVLGAFKAMNWRFPSDPANTLQAAASQHSWFDTKDMAEIILRHHGTNAVEHDLPRPTKKK